MGKVEVKLKLNESLGRNREGLLVEQPLQRHRSHKDTYFISGQVGGSSVYSTPARAGVLEGKVVRSKGRPRQTVVGILR